MGSLRWEHPRHTSTKRSPHSRAAVRVASQVSIHWLGKTDHTSARAVLRAICVLRAHTLNVQGGPAFTPDGMPLPTTNWQDPIAWLSAPVAAAAAVSVAPLQTPVGQDKDLCGYNGCPLASGHSGVCAIESLETKRKVQHTEFLDPAGPSARVSGGLPPPQAPPATAAVPAPKHKADAASYVVLPTPSEDLPPGWSVELRETGTGRKYKVYSKPGEPQCDSRKKAWSAWQTAGGVPPQQQQRPPQPALPAAPAAARQQPVAGLAASSAARLENSPGRRAVLRAVLAPAAPAASAASAAPAASAASTASGASAFRSLGAADELSDEEVLARSNARLGPMPEPLKLEMPRDPSRYRD